MTTQDEVFRGSDIKDISKVVLVSSNYPNSFYNWAPWNKLANITVSRLNNLKIEVVAPLPYSIPFEYLPYNKLYRIPKMEHSEEGIVHRPRFLYLLPKNIFYGIVGDFYQRKLYKYISKNLEKPDLFHAHQAYLDGYGLLNISTKWSTPLIVDIHSSDSVLTWLNNRFVNKKFIKVLNYSSKIICISDSLCTMIKKLGINNEKIESVPLGVDINKFKPRNKEKIKKEFGIKYEKIILFVGYLIKRKGVKYLIESIFKLQYTKEDFKVFIIGDGPEKNELLNLSKKLGLEKKISFLGEIKGDVLLKWFSVTDIFVLPSLAEGRPIAIYEAMASECAIISTNVDGIPEQVKEGYNGFLVNKKDVVALTERIKTLLENEKLIKKMGIKSRKRVIDEGWTWEGYGRRINNVYNDVICNK